MIDDPQMLARFGSSLGIGLLMGLVRQRSSGALAGLRTFALVALLGSVIALLTERTGAVWLLPAGMLALAGTMVLAYQTVNQADDAGTTSTVAVLLCFCLGAMAWLGPPMTAVAVALAATALLHFKPELHGFAQRLTPEDVRSILRFAVVSLLILPLLPDQGYGPYQALNPHRIWLMVVLISGMSLGGYLMLQLVGSNHGVALMGLFGGMVSSTATTLAFARQVRADAGQIGNAQRVILLANIVVLLRIAALAVAVSRDALPSLLPTLTGGFIAGSAWVVWQLRSSGPAAKAELRIAAPSQMRAALSFAAFFALVCVAVAWLQDHVGTQGVYLGAALSGLTDVDAISLSAMEMFETQRLDGRALALTVLVAYVANLMFKLGMTAVVAGPALARRVLGSFAAITVGLVGGWLIG